MKLISSVFLLCFVLFSIQGLSQEWIVRFHEPSEISVKELPDSNWTRIEHLSQRMNIDLFHYTGVLKTSKEQLDLLYSYPQVMAAEENSKVESRASQLVPNDPSFNQNTQWNMYTIQAPEAWFLARGGVTQDSTAIVIAVIDESFDMGHSDLAFYSNPHEIAGNQIDDDQNGYVDDINGWNVYKDTGYVSARNAFDNIDPHGTSVSSIAAGLGNNGIGIAGVSWNTQILPIQGSATNESIVVKAYDYVLTLRETYNRTNGDSGAFVVATNSSFGINRGDPADYPIWCSMYDDMGQAGILSVAATANAGYDVDIEGDIPTTCASEFLLAVTNSNIDDKRVQDAAFGEESIDFAAPGENVFVANYGGSFRSDDGTSFAAPHLAGALGLLYSAIDSNKLDSLLGVSEAATSRFFRDYLLYHGYDVVPDLVNQVAEGRRLNIYKAVDALISGRNITSIVPEIRGESKLVVYPNPTSGGRIWVNQPCKSIRLLTMNGQTLQTEVGDDLNSLELPEVTPGIYILECDLSNGNRLVERKVLSIVR